LGVAVIQSLAAPWYDSPDGYEHSTHSLFGYRYILLQQITSSVRLVPRYPHPSSALMTAVSNPTFESQPAITKLSVPDAAETTRLRRSLCQCLTRSSTISSGSQVTTLTNVASLEGHMKLCDGTHSRGRCHDVWCDSGICAAASNNAMNLTVRPVTRLATSFAIIGSKGGEQGARPSRPAGYRER
jgi:hypothetical protein